MALTEPPLAPTPSAPVPTAGPAAAPGVRRRALLGTRRRQIGAAALIAAAISFLVVQGLGNATQYYKTVPQAIAARTSLGSTQFRIMGTVDPDVREVGGRTEFTISYLRAVAQVIDSKEPPQLFKPGVPVVLEGHWSGTVFQSDLIMVKHTAIYNPAERAVLSTTVPSTPAAPTK